MDQGENGFTLIELISIVVILGVISVVTAAKFGGSGTTQLQASRDSVVAALLVAQQRAMAQMAPVRAVIGTNQVDIEQYDGAAWQSIRVGAIQYPIVLMPGQTLTPTPTFTYDRLGRTTGATLTLQGSGSATIAVSDSGFSQ